MGKTIGKSNKQKTNKGEECILQQKKKKGEVGRGCFELSSWEKKSESS